MYVYILYVPVEDWRYKQDLSLRGPDTIVEEDLILLVTLRKVD